MKRVSEFFLYTYAGLLVLAGLWGLIGSPRIDFRWLFHWDPRQLNAFPRVNLLSQYRFLRGLELGYGLAAFAYGRAILEDPRFTRVFLLLMALGAAGRMISCITDGRPSNLMLFFMLYELAGIGAIGSRILRPKPGLP